VSSSPSLLNPWPPSCCFSDGNTPCNISEAKTDDDDDDDDVAAAAVVVMLLKEAVDRRTGH
jgi:hypothetical protein